MSGSTNIIAMVCVCVCVCFERFVTHHEGVTVVFRGKQEHSLSVVRCCESLHKNYHRVRQNLEGNSFANPHVSPKIETKRL